MPGFALPLHSTSPKHPPGNARWLALIVGLYSAGTVWAQTPVVRPPVVDYRMDVNTTTAPGDKAQKNVSIALTTQRRPGGTEVVQTVPSGLRLGNSLTLRPAPATPTTAATTAAPTASSSTAWQESLPTQVKVYWGCADAVQPGQPQVVTLTPLQAAAMAQWVRGALPPEDTQTAPSGLTPAVWPPRTTDAQALQLPRQATVAGRHTLSGEGVPVGMQFTVDADHNFLPGLQLSASGGNSRPLTLHWAALPAAKGYGLSAVAANGREFVVWLSSAPRSDDLRWPLYASQAQLKDWQARNVLLPSDQRECAIPAGILSSTDGGLLEATAYGDEWDATVPNRPSDARGLWLPDWRVRIRVRSGATLPLDANGVAGKVHQDKPLMPAIPGVPVMPDLSGALKGLFGR